MDCSSSKDAIQRGRSWPLKRSLVDAELERWRIADVVQSVAYMDGQRRQLHDGMAITVHYIGERIKTWQGPPGSVQLRIYAVPSADRLAAETELLEVGLPAACEWVAGISGRPETWRWESHSWSYQWSLTPADGAS